MKALGITVQIGAPLENISADETSVQGTFNGEVLKAEMMLVAIGRAVNTTELQLDRAGIAATEHGLIAIDESCRTSVPNIFAIGDVVDGNQQLAHVATSQGVVAAEVAAGIRR